MARIGFGIGLGAPTQPRLRHAENAIDLGSRLASAPRSFAAVRSFYWCLSGKKFRCTSRVQCKLFLQYPPLQIRIRVREVVVNRGVQRIPPRSNTKSLG